MMLKEERVPGYRAQSLLESVLRFRRAWSRYHRPDDVNHLLRLFRRVSLQRGYVLDYLPMGGGAAGWIWPYARREEAGVEAALPPALAAIARDRLVGERGSGELRNVEVETLYRHLSYERSPVGLFEYAFFILELWSTKSASKASEWLEGVPIFTRRAFDSVLHKAARVRRVARPESYDPLAWLDPSGGGGVRFLVYHSGAWKRIHTLNCHIDAQGSVQHEAGALVANLG